MPNLYIGTIVNVRGFKGELFISDVPREIGTIAPGSKVMVGFSEKFAHTFIVSKWKKSGSNGAVLMLKGIENDVKALQLKEQGLYIDEADIRKANQGIRLANEIIGCQVYDIDTNKLIGEIIDIWYLPANDVWLVETEEGELPVPVIDQIIKFKDLDAKIVKIYVMPGLMDLTSNSGSIEDE